MSTIEKAAARLAGRPKPEPPAADDAPADVPETGLEDVGAAQAGAGSQDRTLHEWSRAPVTGLPLYGDHFCEIDVEAVQEKGYLTPNLGRSQLAQEMRRIKRPLLMNIQKARVSAEPAPPANLIMITSALPAEGKTFISINLAMSIAKEVDRSVLLVDADVARGDISVQLGIEPARGLSDLLREDSYVTEDGVLTTNIERLSILPAGAPVDHIDEYFASDLMGEITRALAEEDPNRVVIFDGPPLIATTEASVLARHMGQTVVVVEANRTPQDAVAQAVGQLDGCANVALVLNKTTGKDLGSGYGYGYGYGYGSEGENAYRRRAEYRPARDAAGGDSATGA